MPRWPTSRSLGNGEGFCCAGRRIAPHLEFSKASTQRSLIKASEHVRKLAVVDFCLVGYRKSSLFGCKFSFKSSSEKISARSIFERACQDWIVTRPSGRADFRHLVCRPSPQVTTGKLGGMGPLLTCSIPCPGFFLPHEDPQLSVRANPYRSPGPAV